MGPVHPQLPGIPRRRHRPMDRPHRGQPTNPLLRAVGDRDSTTAEGWLRKSNFVSHGEKDADAAVKLATARKLADMLIETDQHHAALTVVPGEAQSGGRFSFS